MGFFSDIFKPVKKVFKKVAKEVKRAVKDVVDVVKDVFDFVKENIVLIAIVVIAIYTGYYAGNLFGSSAMGSIASSYVYSYVSSAFMQKFYGLPDASYIPGIDPYDLYVAEETQRTSNLNAIMDGTIFELMAGGDKFNGTGAGGQFWSPTQDLNMAMCVTGEFTLSPDFQLFNAPMIQLAGKSGFDQQFNLLGAKAIGVMA